MGLLLLAAHWRLPFNTTAYETYRPTIRRLDADLSRLIPDGGKVGAHIPPPPVAECPTDIGNSQHRLEIIDTFTRRRRRVFGYFGDIHLDKEAIGASAPAQMQVVAIAPWSYGGIPP